MIFLFIIEMAWCIYCYTRITKIKSRITKYVDGVSWCGDDSIYNFYGQYNKTGIKKRCCWYVCLQTDGGLVDYDKTLTAEELSSATTNNGSSSVAISEVHAGEQDVVIPPSPPGSPPQSLKVRDCECRLFLLI